MLPYKVFFLDQWQQKLIDFLLLNHKMQTGTLLYFTSDLITSLSCTFYKISFVMPFFVNPNTKALQLFSCPINWYFSCRISVSSTLACFAYWCEVMLTKKRKQITFIICFLSDFFFYLLRIYADHSDVEMISDR